MASTGTGNPIPNALQALVQAYVDADIQATSDQASLASAQAAVAGSNPAFTTAQTNLANYLQTNQREAPAAPVTPAAPTGS